jgi:hypothetical protein
MIKLNNDCVFFSKIMKNSLFDFSFFLRSFVEFLKQIERIHVLFCYSFIVFLWSIFSFNQIINDFFVDFLLQDFLYFVDFVVIKQFRRKILWYDAVVFSSFVRLQVEDMKYIMNAIKWEKNQTISLLIHRFDDAEWFYEFIWEFLTWIFQFDVFDKQHDQVFCLECQRNMLSIIIFDLSIRCFLSFFNQFLFVFVQFFHTFRDDEHFFHDDIVFWFVTNFKIIIVHAEKEIAFNDELYVVLINELNQK